MKTVNSGCQSHLGPNHPSNLRIEYQSLLNALWISSPETFRLKDPCSIHIFIYVHLYSLKTAGLGVCSEQMRMTMSHEVVWRVNISDIVFQNCAMRMDSCDVGICNLSGCIRWTQSLNQLFDCWKCMDFGFPNTFQKQYFNDPNYD